MRDHEQKRNPRNLGYDIRYLSTRGSFSRALADVGSRIPYPPFTDKSYFEHNQQEYHEAIHERDNGQ